MRAMFEQGDAGGAAQAGTPQKKVGTLKNNPFEQVPEASHFAVFGKKMRDQNDYPQLSQKFGKLGLLRKASVQLIDQHVTDNNGSTADTEQMLNELSERQANPDKRATEEINPDSTMAKLENILYNQEQATILDEKEQAEFISFLMTRMQEHKKIERNR